MTTTPPGTAPRQDPGGPDGPAPRTRLRPTPRGWVLAGVALVTLVGAPLTGQRDILRISVLLLVLLAAAAWTATRATRTLDLVSRSRAGIVEAGSPATMRLTVRGRGRPGTRLLLEDHVPLALGGTARVTVPHVDAGQTLDLDHTVRSDVRGSYVVGPAVLRSQDVFGVVEAVRPLGGAVDVDVLPRVHELPGLALGDLGGARGSSASASAASSPDDSSIREYRVGDDLRRVHWRSTARRGAMMVRSDEHPGRPDVVLLLDDRAAAHHGRGAASSLEWAVTAAASAAVHLHRRGHRVRLLHGGTLDAVQDLDQDSAVRALLRSLARLQPGPADGLARSVASLRRLESTLLVAVLGSVDESDVQPLLSSRPLGTPALALLQRTTLWASDGPAPAEDLDRPLQRAHLTLARAGWRTAVAGPRDSVPEVWGRLARAGARPSPAPPAPPQGSRPGSTDPEGVSR